MTLRFNKRLSITPVKEGGGSGDTAKGSFDKATQTLTLNNAYVVDLINQVTREEFKQTILEAVGTQDVIFDLTNIQTMFEKSICYGNITLQGRPISVILDMSGGDYSVTISEGIMCLNSEGLSAAGLTLEQIVQAGGAVDENVFTITGTQGNYDVVFNEQKEYEKKYGADINAILGDVDANGVLQAPTEQVDLVFTGVEDLGEKALAYKFYKNTILKSISFPDLVTVSGNYALDNAFYGGDINGTIYDGLTSISLPKLETVSGYLALSRTFQSNRGITSIELPKLKTISGSNAFANTFDAMDSLTSVSLPELTTISDYMGMSYCFNNDRNLPSVSFPKLSVLTGSQAFYYTFSYDTSLQSVSFPALTSQSFGSYTNQFNRMLNSVTGCTVHFPSNLQSVIGSWSDVTSGFGGTNTTVLFDLPATE